MRLRMTSILKIVNGSESYLISRGYRKNADITNSKTNPRMKFIGTRNMVLRNSPIITEERLGKVSKRGTSTPSSISMSKYTKINK